MLLSRKNLEIFFCRKRLTSKTKHKKALVIKILKLFKKSQNISNLRSAIKAIWCNRWIK